MTIHNFMEDLVIERTDAYLAEATICKCEKCRLDIMAQALNNLKPLYWVTKQGELFTKLNEFRLQFKVDVDVAVIRAAEMISQNPRH